MMKKLLKIIPNPEYEKSDLEAVCLDKDGNVLPRHVAAMLFGRIAPPRYKQLKDGTFEEILSHIPIYDEPDHQMLKSLRR